jgi:hypothetical protein
VGAGFKDKDQIAGVPAIGTVQLSPCPAEPRRGQDDEEEREPFPHGSASEARRRWRGPAIAAAAFVVALAIALPLWLLRGGDEPPAVATSVTTTITASTIATTTTTAATATQEIVVASISVEDASPSVGGPLVAVSAREAWLGMTPSAESGTTLIGHLEDGTWSFYRLDRLRNWMAGILGLAPASAALERPTGVRHGGRSVSHLARGDCR